MRVNPALVVDWDGVSGRVELGSRLMNDDPLAKIDIVTDFKNQINAIYREVHEEMYPGLEAFERRANNKLRRTFAESLQGLAIQAARPLLNGDVLLELSDGRCIVFCAKEEPVNLRVAESFEDASEHARTMIRQENVFTEEPTEEDDRKRASSILERHLLGIDAPV